MDPALTTGHSRFPVLTDDGGVGGIAHIRHGLAVPFTERPGTAVDAAMGTATFVPDTVPLDDRMDTLRAGGPQTAVGIAEVGAAAGLITEEALEDVDADAVD